MPIRITNPNDLGQLNKALQRIDDLEKRLSDAHRMIGSLAKQMDDIHQLHAPLTSNNVTFTWTGATGTVAWSSGSVRLRNNVNVPVLGSQKAGLSASTYYWAAWNDEHNEMIFSTNATGLLQNKNNHVICQFFTGTAGQNGTLGGGGSQSATDLSFQRYKLF